MEMRASFIITTFNRIDELERCIDSIFRQHYEEIEVIVIDDASSDSTSDRVSQKYGKNVKLVRKLEHCGSIKNRNYGVTLATGDILFLIDDDVEIPGNNTVREVMDEFIDDLVGAVGIPFFENEILEQSGDSDLNVPDGYLISSYIGCCCAVRKSTFLSLGGYDEFFYHMVEENDFCLRMLNEGQVCKIAKISVPMIHYQSPKRNFFIWDYYGKRNSLLYVWKNAPGLYLIPNLIITSLRGIAHGIKVQRIYNNLRGVIGGYLAILQSITGKGCKRNPVQLNVYKRVLALRKSPVSYASVRDTLWQ